MRVFLRGGEGGSWKEVVELSFDLLSSLRSNSGVGASMALCGTQQVHTEPPLHRSNGFLPLANKQPSPSPQLYCLFL